MTEQNPTAAPAITPDVDASETSAQAVAKLRERAVELQKRLDDIHRDYRRGLHADSEERAQELENAEVLNEIERVTAEALQQIKDKIAALSSQA